MFVQIIEGKVKDPERVHAALEKWAAELARDATGWLGSTAGVTDDGTFVAVARFESEEAARANSDRPEQDRWWGETSQLFTGEPTFRDSTEVDVDMQGDPDKAGFVQIIEGHSNDPARSRELMNESPEVWAEFRPDVIGSLGVEFDDGDYTAVLYFTTEEEAREGEGKEPPPEVKEQMKQMEALEVGEPTFRDLKQPWMYSPR
jgi:hypothetical protein